MRNMVYKYFVDAAAFMLLMFTYHLTLHFYHKYESVKYPRQDCRFRQYKKASESYGNASVMYLCLILFFLYCSVISF
jgi:hypothetical protein